MLERLWAGWRTAYVQSVSDADHRPVNDDEAASGGSVFSRIFASGLPDSETHIIHRATTCAALLNLYPYGTGHLLVVPYREVADLELLSDDETSELWAVVTDGARALKRAYAPDGLNIGLNLGRPAGGTVAEHLHVHVVPRWTGDSNFMTAIANTRTLPEALIDTAVRVRSAWPVTPPAS